MTLFRKLLILAIAVAIVALTQQGEVLAYGPTLDPVG